VLAAGRQQKEKHIKTFASVMKDHAIDPDTVIFVYIFSWMAISGEPVQRNVA
jgi:hypothetical protein